MADETTTQTTIGYIDTDARGRIRTARGAITVGSTLGLRRVWYVDPPASDPPPSDPPTQPSPKPNPPPPDDAPTLTQKQVDAIISNEKKLAGTASLTALAKKLGFDTVEEMETAAKEAQDTKKKNQSELDREKDARIKAEKERDDERDLRTKAEAERLADKVNTKLESLATKAKVATPEDVVDYLRKHHASEVDGLASDDGKIDDKAAEKLIEVVKKARPNWFAATGYGSPSNKDGRPPQPDNKVTLNRPSRL